MAKKPVIAFIGTGMMGQVAHLANYAQLRDAGECEIAGVCDLKPLLAQAVAEKYRIPRVYTSSEELLGDPAIDAVVCIQQWANNYNLVKSILLAGKSAITEKPMVGRLDQAEELTALAKEKGVLYAVGFMKRYDAGVELGKRIIDGFRASQELGPLLTVDAFCNGGDWIQNAGGWISVNDPTPLPPLRPDYPDHCTTPEQRKAYDYLINIFAHNVNLTHYLLGAELQAHAAQFLDDRALQALLRHGNIPVTLRGTNSAAHEWREYTVFTFREGEVTVTTPTPLNRQKSGTVTVLRKEKDGLFTTTQYHAPVSWAFFNQAQGFVRALAGTEALHTPAELAVWDVRVMEHIIEIAEVL